MVTEEPVTDEWFNAHYEPLMMNWGSFESKAECKKCHVDVRTKITALRGHVEWHEGIDELIEWAQAVDKRLFPNMKPVFPQTEAGIQHDGA